MRTESKIFPQNDYLNCKYLIGFLETVNNFKKLLCGALRRYMEDFFFFSFFFKNPACIRETLRKTRKGDLLQSVWDCSVKNSEDDRNENIILSIHLTLFYFNCCGSEKYTPVAWLRLVEK